MFLGIGSRIHSSYVPDNESESGWLIFKTGPSELGVHPTTSTYEGETYSHLKHHLISLMCDDVEATKAELEGKGAQFAGEIEDLGYGLAVMLKVPGRGRPHALRTQAPRSAQSLSARSLKASASRPRCFVYSRSCVTEVVRRGITATRPPTGTTSIDAP